MKRRTFLKCLGVFAVAPLAFLNAKLPASTYVYIDPPRMYFVSSDATMMEITKKGVSMFLYNEMLKQMNEHYKREAEAYKKVGKK